MEIERKFCNTLEIKSDSENGTFEGYGSTFNNIDLDDDVIQKGAFLDSIKGLDYQIPLFYGHQYDSENILGLAEVKEDERGLFVKGQIYLEDSKSKKIYNLMKNRVLKSMSIGFLTKEHSYESRETKSVRVIKKAELKEVSIVPFPANPKALISSVKSREGISSIRDFEDFLRDSGFTRKEACLIASKGFKALNQSDSEEIIELIKNNSDVLRSIK